MTKKLAPPNFRVAPASPNVGHDDSCRILSEDTTKTRHVAPFDPAALSDPALGDLVAWVSGTAALSRVFRQVRAGRQVPGEGRRSRERRSRAAGSAASVVSGRVGPVLVDGSGVRTM